MGTIQERMNRWDRFYDVGSDVRRMVIADGFSEPGDAARALELGVKAHWPENAAAHVEWAVARYADQMRRAEWLHDDVVPNVNLLSGSEIFAECFGCRVVRTPENMPFALHAVENASEAARLKKPDIWDSPLRVQFEKADYARRLEPEAMLRLPDMQSPLDIAALIWNKGDFYCALIEQPDAAHALCELCYELICDFLDEWFRRYGTEYTAHFPEYPMRGGLTISEDEIGAVSREIFYEYSLPYLNRLSRRYGGIGVHCCANSRHQWEGLARIEGLRLINLHQPAEVLTESVPVFEDVAVQMPIDGGFDHACFSRAEFARAHMVELIPAWNMSRGEVIDAIERIRG